MDDDEDVYALWREGLISSSSSSSESDDLSNVEETSEEEEEEEEECEIGKRERERERERQRVLKVIFFLFDRRIERCGRVRSRRRVRCKYFGR